MHLPTAVLECTRCAVLTGIQLLLLASASPARPQTADVLEVADLHHFGDLESPTRIGSLLKTAVDPVALGEDRLAIRRIGGEERFSLQIYSNHEGIWGLEDEITETGQSPFSSFGDSLSFAGDALAVSYADDDLPGLLNTGSTHIYRRSPAGTWSLEAVLTASDASSNSGFGNASMDGDRVLIGAAFESSTATQAGAAYIFERMGGSWAEVAKLEATTPVQFERLGRSVVLRGNQAFLGTRTGARVFRQAGGTWSEEANLITPSVPEGNLASDGVTLAIVESQPLGNTSPRCFLYEQTVGSWSHVATVQTSQSLPLSEFGTETTVDLVNGRLFMGTDEIDNTSNSLLLGAWLAERTPGGWPTEADPFEMRAPADGSLFPGSTSVRSIAANGESIAVLAPNLLHPNGEFPKNVLIFKSAESPPAEFCFGSDPGTGCGTCPCGNASSLRAFGGCLSSAGSTPQLFAGGLPRASKDTLRFDLRHAAPGTFAVLFSGDRQLPAMGPCPQGSGVFGTPAADGLRCVGMNLIRHGARALNAEGNSPTPWGDADPATSPGLVSESGATPGQTRHWQAFYRESVSSGCGTGLGSSQAISVTAAP